jgi:hypothetical protein
MNSIMNVVKVGYGTGDAPCPRFSCPVVVEGPVLQLIKGAGNANVGSIVDEAAQAVELVSRFERHTQWVDFYPRLSLSIGELPVAMRIELVRSPCGNVARIRLSDAVVSRFGGHR